jgi:hypothetical protein
MKTAICDPLALLPLLELTSGRVIHPKAFSNIELVIRTFLLHDATEMVRHPLASDGSKDPLWRFVTDNSYPKDAPTPIELALRFEGIECELGSELFPVHIGEVPDIELPTGLIEIAAQFAKTGKRNPRFKAHCDYLKLAISTVLRGGSAVLGSAFGRRAFDKAGEYPLALFDDLDKEWQTFIREIEKDGLGVVVPPVLAIVLTRCARLDAIPAIMSDLRQEWAGARSKVWRLLDELGRCRTLGEATEIRKELADASRLFSPTGSTLDSQPVRVLWEIVAAGTAGAAIAALSGGKAGLGAVAGALTQAARNLPGLTHEFGSMLFGRGAFDLARRVRRSLSDVELDALARLLPDAEKQKLGLK